MEPWSLKKHFQDGIDLYCFEELSFIRLLRNIYGNFRNAMRILVDDHVTYASSSPFMLTLILLCTQTFFLSLDILLHFGPLSPFFFSCTSLPPTPSPCSFSSLPTLPIRSHLAHLWNLIPLPSSLAPPCPLPFLLLWFLPIPLPFLSHNHAPLSTLLLALSCPFASFLSLLSYPPPIYPTLLTSFLFLDASSPLYDRVCPSVRRFSQTPARRI